ncbi:PAS domain S-box protein [Coleofasciculus sp. FACHB-1120]|uniref:PAS domain S-box protein n=1 Tax=Coleofasciculus sp. FACHB-1120 TaxID=2692783 RepID=UPI0016854EAA|nr:PAS domain S-box protein [Coleofasciculus sp. FACHB-1120]MBD2743461.1 PAS domain S-box protein [Coleofasciculus sp. FACHB-1120]
MRLRTKTLMVIGATLVGLVGVLYATSSIVLLRSLKQAEEQNTRQLVRAVLNVFSQTEDDFSSRFRDWSSWDDTYNFINNPNQAYIASNLNPGSLNTLRINLVLFINNSGEIVFGTGFDLKNQKKTPIPPALKEHLALNDRLLERPNSNRILSGIILLPEGLMLISSQPILPSTGKGSIRGTLIFGRYIDDRAIEKLARINRLPVMMYGMNNPQMPADFQAVRSALSEQRPILVRSRSEDTISGYAQIKDIYGKPALLLRVDVPREIYKQGKIRLGYLILCLLVVGLVFGGVTLLLIERLVLSRLAALSAGVRKIGASSDLSLRVSTPGKDELSSLALTINGMLEALEKSGRDRIESEERHRAVVEQASEGIVLIDARSAQILEANTAFKRLLGYSHEEILQLTLDDLIPHNRDSIDFNIEQILANKQHYLGERRYRRKDGTLVDVEVSANSISYGGKEVVCGVVRDISEAKRDEVVRKQAQEEIRLLQTTTQAIADSSDFHSALQVTLGKVCETIGWSFGEAWIPHLGSDFLECSRGWYGGKDEVSPALKKFRHRSQKLTFTFGKGLPGRVWSSQQPEWIDDVSTVPPAVFERAAIAQESGLKASFAIPIIATTFWEPSSLPIQDGHSTGVPLGQSQVLAVLLFFNFDSQEEDRRLVELVSGVAAQLGSVIQRKQIETTLQESETRLRRQQLVLMELATCQALYTGDLSAAWQEITKTATNTLGVERASIWLYQQEIVERQEIVESQEPASGTFQPNPTLVCVDLYEVTQERHSWGMELHRVDYPGYFQALEEERTIAASDAHTDPRTKEFSAAYLTPLGITSMLDVPIRVGGRTMGVLCLEHIGTPKQWALEEQNFATYLAYMAALAMEASDRKQAETALANSEAKFRSLILNSSDLIAIYDADGITRYQSPSIVSILGYQPEELTGVHTLGMIHPEDRRRVLEAFHEALNNPQSVFSVEYRFPRKDGSWCFLESTGSNLLADPFVAGIVVNSRDITERKQVEGALRQAEERYRSIFENAVEGIFQTTPDGRFINANPALARLYGYSSPEELIANVTSVERQLYVDPNRRTEFIAAMQKYDSVSRFESQIYRQDGSTIWILETARTVKNSQGRILYYEGTVQDITNRKVAEEALRYQQEQSELLLLNILPAPIAERLKLQESIIADSFAEVTVLFADIVGFTQLSADTSPTELVELLNKIFSAFDRLSELHGLEKIKTIGDAYMVVGGLPMPRSDHAQAIADMALDMQGAIALFNLKNAKNFQIRVGISTGPVVAGVIGIKKFIYDLWGDTVNTASRMESHGLAGRIQVTNTTYELLRDEYVFEERGLIHVKGKGEMTTYLLIGRKKGEF